jgi:hypothetical protein
MKKQMHLAAQYLAAAGISFLEKQDDDSHTNLGFSTENGCLYSHTFSENSDMLCLDYERFSLEWKSNQGTTSFRLDGASHTEVIIWLSDTSKTFLNKDYHYKFHYDLPYEISDTYTFKLLNVGQLIELMHLRILAQFTIERILNDNNLESSIRVWPHHFDTGAFADFKDGSNLSIGFGLAIPDDVCNEHYMYISGYKDNKIMNTSSFENLKIGEWKNDGFKGAILPTKDLKEAEVAEFFQEAINNFKNTK